jgi:glycosyltransferase involved in cell wall biosynthesis
MKTWIVNPFDPLPGDPEQEGRYATLARLLIKRGHTVTWWTSAFSHRFKRPVDQPALRTACHDIGIEPIFLPSPPYQTNVGFARLRNHAALTRAFAQAAPQAARPDVIVVSSPPPSLSAAAVQVGRQVNAPSLIDVQDLWPDTFASLLPPLVRPLARPAMWFMRKNVRRAARGCTAIVGVADRYVENSHKEAGTRKITATIPLGVELAELDAAAERGRCDQFAKPADQLWFAYTGSLNRNYDFMTILRAAGRLREQYGDRLRFFVTGRGEFAQQAEQLVRDERLTNVTLTGFLEWDTWAYLLYQCDACFNASFPEALIFLPNKIFYYLAASAVVLNTIPGQCSQIVRDGRCGLDYEAGNVESCMTAIRHVAEQEALRREMGQAARQLAEREYDRAILFPRYAELIEEVAGVADAGTQA